MGASVFLVSSLGPFVLLIVALLVTHIVSGYQQIKVSENTTLQFLPHLVVDKSPDSKPGFELLFERILIHGFPRLRHLKKFPNSLKIKVSLVNPGARQSNVEVCFHINTTLGVGMCSQRQWEKLNKGLWVKSMSPFDNKIIDIRTGSPGDNLLQVSVVEDFFLYRVVFLVLGIVLLTIAAPLSKSLVFYYGGAMTVGILLVILIVIFQGMRLLPIGRKNSFAIVLYSSILIMFLPVFLVIAGAWLGFWIVRKLILTEDGDIDDGVSEFVSWSIRIISISMILQCSLDPLMAVEALFLGILFSIFLRKSNPLKLIHHMYRRIRRLRKLNKSKFRDACFSPVQEYTKSSLNFQGFTGKLTKQVLDSEPFYSTFHDTTEKRKFSKDEWNRFTKVSTKRALKELVSSPDFGKWAIAHADRLTLARDKDVIS